MLYTQESFKMILQKLYSGVIQWCMEEWFYYLLVKIVQYDGVISMVLKDSSNVANGEGCLLFPDGTEYSEVFKDNK